MTEATEKMKGIRVLANGEPSIGSGRLQLRQLARAELNPAEVAEAMGLRAENDPARLAELSAIVIQEHPECVASYRKGKHGVVGFLVAKVMEKTRGGAHPEITTRAIMHLLDTV
jgi:Asp-tRNA(Asn)/Glu-tRNA(Gln) amidotransferase B subunit